MPASASIAINVATAAVAAQRCGRAICVSVGTPQARHQR